MNFMNAMKNELNKEKTYTENGAVAYATSGKELLDFSFETTALRDASEPEIENKFIGVYFENPLVAMRYLFWLRDCRGGNGERRIFRVCLKALAKNKPSVAKAVLPLVPEYGRWDDLWCLLDTGLKDDVIALVKKQLAIDMEAVRNNWKISLLSKWMGSSNTSSKETRRLAEILRTGLVMSPKTYRKTLSMLRSYGNVVETYASSNNWSEINYSAVPSQANLKYKNAFMHHDEERRRAYLESLVKGEAKINAGTLQPHEIVAKYMSRYSSWMWGKQAGDYDETLEQLWKNLPDMTAGNMLIVHDSSGSMLSHISGNTTCLDVATALAIYMSEHNTGNWSNKFVTFSSNPKIVDLSNCKTLRDKLEYISRMNDCSNTDIYKTMMLILDTAKNNRIPQSEMPEMITICSDMQFDGRWFNLDKTLFENIIDRFEEAGYKMPRICFWNISDRISNTIPLQKNDLGLILCSGFSVQIMTMFMSNELDPYKVLLDTINAPRYDPVEDAIKDVI